jgi:hypothetical protein
MWFEVSAQREGMARVTAEEEGTGLPPKGRGFLLGQAPRVREEPLQEEEKAALRIRGVQQPRWVATTPETKLPVSRWVHRKSGSAGWRPRSAGEPAWPGAATSRPASVIQDSDRRALEELVSGNMLSRRRDHSPWLYRSSRPQVNLRSLMV